jgi:hypothetical protein
VDISQSAAALMGALPFGFLGGVAVLRFAQGVDRPRALVEGYLAWTIVSYAATEIFGFFHQLTFLPFLVLWIIGDGCLLYWIWRARERAVDFFRCRLTLPGLILTAIVLVTLFIALTTAPNNWDSQTYHLPRIEHWIQDRSLEFYPTSIPRQNDYGPLAEILLLQTRVLGGLDLLYPFIQWLSMLCSLAAVFRITRQLGGNETQCWISVVFLATLPIGILESTSTQNDYVVGALLACFVTLGLEAISQPRASFGLTLAAVAAVGLSGIVKPVGYLLGSGFALWFAIGLSTRVALGTWIMRAAGVLAVLALVMGPSASRYISAHAGAQSDLAKLAANGSFGIRQTLDNLVRDSMLNFNTGIPQIDELTNRVVEATTSRLGLDIYREDTSEPGHPVSMPPIGIYIFHEENGPNLIHSILLILALLSTMIRWREPVPLTRRFYLGAWLIGIIVFAALLRWNPWQTRYHLPAFVLVSPLVATAWPERWSHSRTTMALFLFLGFTSLPVLFLNQSRELLPLSRNRPFPLLRDRPSYLSTSAMDRLFVNQQQLLGPYRDAVETIVRSRASQVGLILGGDSWEYPIWRMLRDRQLNYRIRIEHVAVPTDAQWPLGPFLPEVLFWNNGDAPPTLTINGRQFVRAGPPGTIAAYTRAGLASRGLFPLCVVPALTLVVDRDIALIQTHEARC